MNDYQIVLDKIRAELGSYDAIGEVCGISGRAVKKWRDSGKPPRTEYSGETEYAKKLIGAVGDKLKITQDDLVPRLKIKVA